MRRTGRYHLARPRSACLAGAWPASYGSEMNRDPVVSYVGARPSSVAGKVIGVRLDVRTDTELDLWIATQPDHPSRPEAIRRLVAVGLKASAASIEPAEVRQALEERLR
jgi:hypothetical protein